MSYRLTYTCDLCGGSEDTNTLFNVWLRPLVINFSDKILSSDVDIHICECCIKGIVNEAKDKGYV